MIRRRKPIDRGSTPLEHSPLKRSTKRIAQRSERVLAQLPERARVVDAAWERDQGRCQAEHLVPDVRCGGPLDAHEIIPRSAWAQGYLCVDNVILVCRAMHNWIDDRPLDAEAVGLRIPRQALYTRTKKEVLAEAGQLRDAMRRGDPTYPSWFTNSDRATAPLSHLGRLHRPAVEGRER